MPTRKRLLLMFTPLLLGFTLLVAVIADLKHPDRQPFDCSVAAIGQDALPLVTAANMLYRNSNNDAQTMAFTCPKLGTVAVNDAGPFLASDRVSRGNRVEIVRSTYAFLPTRWRISVANDIESCGALCEEILQLKNHF